MLNQLYLASWLRWQSGTGWRNPIKTKWWPKLQRDWKCQGTSILQKTLSGMRKLLTTRKYFPTTNGQKKDQWHAEIDKSQGRNRNFLGQGIFLGISALRQAFTYNTRKQGPTRKKSQVFWTENSFKFHRWPPTDDHSQLTTIRVFFLQISALFSIFGKRHRRPTHPPPQFAPSSYGYELGNLL